MCFVKHHLIKIGVLILNFKQLKDLLYYPNYKPMMSVFCEKQSEFFGLKLILALGYISKIYLWGYPEIVFIVVDATIVRESLSGC